jgi:hypothetical protein
MKRQMNWPTAFALVFGGLPALVLAVFVLCAYPIPALCFSTGVALFVLGDRAGRRKAAVAARAAAEYRHNAALVAQPLSPMPTARRHRTLHDAPTLPARAIRR